jgi:hypothetical protein
MEDEKGFRDDKERDHTQPHFESVLSQTQIEGAGRPYPQALTQERSVQKLSGGLLDVG